MTSVTCAACGAVIRATRRSCLRCGAPLKQAPQPAGGRRSIPLTAIAAVAVLLLSGVASLYVGEREIAANPVKAAVRAPDTRGDSTSGGTDADPVAVAFDANRAGGAAYDRGEIAGALEDFQAAVEAHPDNPVALNNLAQALVRDGRAGDAIAYFDRAIALAPGTWAYHFNRARAYGQLEQWPLAVAGYHEAARLFPDDYVTEYNLARALRAAGQLDEAIAGFERAIALAPGQADFHLSHGLALEAAGRRADAAAAYQRYLELEPDAPDAARVRSRAEYLQRAGVTPTTGGQQ